MIAAALLALALAAGAEALDVDVAPYRQAAQSGEVGVVTGRVYEESRKSSGPARPLAGVTVALVPRSAALLTSLERFKEDARGSSRAFAAAAPAMRKAQEAYERELVVAGAPDLASRVAAGPDGAFRLADVPAGAWLVLAWHSTPVDVSPPKARGREHQTYQLGGRTTGFQAVTIWLREVTIARGELVSLELTDRNEWFRGVIEEKSLDAGR
ncbi:MAG TPA: hypothetical protein VMQ51_07550 [Candidatus Binatia bacterium]|nr:hypothetical protein [Candidatus Binatia bacterium]